MDSIQRLYEERKRVHNVMDDLLKRAANEKRSMTGDEEQSWDKANKDFDEYTKQIDQHTRAAQAAKLISDQPDQVIVPGDNVQLRVSHKQEDVKNAEKAYADSFWRFFRATKDQTIAAQDMSILQKRGTDIQVVGTPGLGGYTVPEEWANMLIKTMAWYGGALDAGAILTTSGGNKINNPRVKYPGGGASAIQKGALITETTADAVADITFENVELDAYTYTSKLILQSWELLQDSGYNPEGNVRDIAAERLGRIANEHLTTGTGSGQPNGMVTASSLGKTAAGASAITATELVDLEHSVDPAYRKMAGAQNVGFMFADSTLALIKKLSYGTTDDRPLWLPSIREGEPDKILGYRYWINSDMAAATTGLKSVLFGNFSKYTIRIAKNVEFVILREKYADQRCNGYFAYMRMDGELMDTNAIKHLIQA